MNSAIHHFLHNLAPGALKRVQLKESLCLAVKFYCRWLGLHWCCNSRFLNSLMTVSWQRLFWEGQTTRNACVILDRWQNHVYIYPIKLVLISLMICFSTSASFGSYSSIGTTSNIPGETNTWWLLQSCECRIANIRTSNNVSILTRWVQWINKKTTTSETQMRPMWKLRKKWKN